jgi:hypothetical protein
MDLYSLVWSKSLVHTVDATPLPDFFGFLPLPLVLLQLVVGYAPCSLELEVAHMHLHGHPKTVMWTQVYANATTIYHNVLVRRGGHHARWMEVHSEGRARFARPMYDHRRYLSLSIDQSRPAVVGFHWRPARLLVVYTDSEFQASLQGRHLTLQSRSLALEVRSNQVRDSAELRLCRVLGTYDFMVAGVHAHTHTLHVHKTTLSYPGVLIFNWTGSLVLPCPPRRWHVVGLCALPDFALIHVQRAGSRESLLVAQIGSRPPELLSSVPDLQLSGSGSDSLLGVCNLGDDHVLVGVHRAGYEELIRINST